MGALRDRFEVLRTALEDFAPSRWVDRNLKDSADQPSHKLREGIFTVICVGEEDFANYRGREAQFGRTSLWIVGQIELPEDATRSEIEDAEFALVEEIKAFTRSPLPAGVDSLVLLSWSGSMQVEAPYGFVRCELEMMSE